MERHEAIKSFVQKHGIDIRSFAEIGVYRAECSKHLVSYWPDAKAYLVDPWLPYDPGLGLSITKRFSSTEENEKFYQEVVSEFKDNPNVYILRNTSVEASLIVPNNLDLVFIDARHEYEYVKEDIMIWMPKLHTGGVLCGHDFGKPWIGVVKAVSELIVKSEMIGDSVWATIKDKS